MPCSIIILLLGEKLLVLFKVLLQNTQYSVYFLDKFLKQINAENTKFEIKIIPKAIKIYHNAELESKFLSV